MSVGKSGTPTRKYYIGGIEDYPKEFFDNEYLRRGYRIGFKSWTEISKSVFMWHNETMNIWTHLIGAIIFLVVALYIGIYYPNMESEGKILYDEFQSFSNTANLSEFVNIKINEIEQSNSLMADIENLSYLAAKTNYTNLDVIKTIVGFVN